MEPFKLPGGDTRLITHKETVYKIKLVYNTGNKESNNRGLPCDVNSMQCEIKEAISVILLGNQTPLKTDHFIIHTESKKWIMASLLIFTVNGRRLRIHPSVLTLSVHPREDLGDQSIEHQHQSPQAESANQNEPARRIAHQSSASSPGGSRQHTRSFTVKEDSSSSPPPPKKPRSTDKRNLKDQPAHQQGVSHKQYLLRRRATSHEPATRGQQWTRDKYHLRSQGLLLEGVSYAKDQQGKLRPRMHGGDAMSSEARMTRKGTQEYSRDTSHRHEAEPMVGATAGAESRPAHPQGGVVQHDIHVQQPAGQHDGEQYQLDEQMRLQRLAGNQQTDGPPTVAHYQLRPRGTLERLMNAVLTPVKNLFS